VSKLKLGVIGVGRMAQVNHLPILADLPQVELVAFCDVDAGNLEARSDEYSVASRYSDHHDMFESETLDAVCVFIPPFAHTDAELIAAREGIHLFVEKPPALSMEKAHEIAAAIDRAGIINAVGFNERYRTSVDVALERLEGERPVQVLTHRLHGSTAAAYWWMVEELSGGAFVENTIHAADLMRYLGAEPTSVSAVIVDRPEKTEDLDIPLSHCATYTLEGGGAANVTTCTALAGHGHSSFLLVAGGSLYDLSGGALAVDGEPVASDENRRACYEREFAAFADASLNNDPDLIRSPYSDAVRSLATVLGAVDSARNGGAPVQLDRPPYTASQD
jgi:predicted dehydrogenase